MKKGGIFGGSEHCCLNAAGSGVTECGGTFGCCTQFGANLLFCVYGTLGGGTCMCTFGTPGGGTGFSGGTLICSTISRCCSSCSKVGCTFGGGAFATFGIGVTGVGGTFGGSSAAKKMSANACSTFICLLPIQRNGVAGCGF
eukprot:12126844-Ditylum_brightwellii.AAC.1